MVKIHTKTRNALSESGLSKGKRAKRRKGRDMEQYEFYKNNESDTIYWVDNVDSVGERLFTFDKKRIFNLFADYPHSLTSKQKAIFDKENPEWADFFKDRK